MDSTGARADREIRFEAIFEQSPFSMQLLDAQGRTLRVNKAWEALWVPPDAAGLKEWVLREYNVLHDPQLEKKGITAQLRRAYAGESVELAAIEYDPAELGQVGNVRWVRGYAHPVRDADGQVREVMLIHEDVSGWVARDAALRSTEERLRTAILAGNIGIWEWDLETGKVKWSDELYRLYGLEPEPGEHREFLSRVLPEDRAMVEQRARAAAERGDGFSAEFRGVLPDGELRWLSTWARFLPAQDGARRMIGATISIDAHKKAEAALREGDRRKDEFLAMLAHELRNPLSPIASAAEVLRMGADAERTRRAAEVIGRQVRHITKLMDDLLDVSRVTRGLVHLDKQPVEISSVLHSAIEQAAPLLDAKGHTLSTTMDAPRAVVLGDRARLVQILVNLLNNAARYTPDGGRIDVSLHAREGLVTVRVADTGQGIEPALLPHVFELFTQGKRSPDRAQGGLGMGLALVKRLVELHGGRVVAESAGPGAGSTFIVDLPLAQSTAADGVRAVSRRREEPARLRVMVVDDNRDAADSLATLLSMAGHDAEVHYDGRGALASTALAATQVFVLDIGLPDMDGYALARELRKRGVTALLVALTGYGQPPDREASRAAGFDHHIVKPVEWTALAELLRVETAR